MPQNFKAGDIKQVLAKTPPFKGKLFNLAPLNNAYGINKDIFKCDTSEKSYFIKVTDKQQNHEAQKIVSQYLQTPLKYLDIQFNNKQIEIYEFIQGDLLTDIFKEKENNSDNSKNLLYLEDKKNKELLNLYKKTRTKIPYQKILQGEANALYQKRFMGERFKEYYDNIRFKSLFDKKITLNGKEFPTVNYIVEEIQKKYLQLNNNLITDAFVGHGDSHHQNVIYQKDADQLFFIDNEYNSYTTMNMELSKPYYIDLLGTDLYFFNQTLFDIFDIKSYIEQENSVIINTTICQLPQNKIDTANNKVKVFENLLRECNDPLSLNDYLVINHMVGRNPMQFNPNTFILFLSLIPVLKIFNSNNAKEIFSFFE